MSDIYVRTMVRALLECAMWADCRDAEGAPAADDLTVWDFTLTAAKEALSTCRDFLDAADSDDDCIGWRDGWTAEQAGYDLWLSRNGHGAGFWDRGHEQGKALHALAKRYGSRLVWRDASHRLHFE